MPRRTSARTVTSPATPQVPPALQHLETPYDANIHQLRRHWKWAAFSQFFFTFSPLLAMTDVTLTDVENDLVHSTNRVLARIMQRLLITLTQDRKITTDSWQNALRRQYQRRGPEASPIGLPSRSHHTVIESSRASTVPPSAALDMPPNEADRENEYSQHGKSTTSSPDNLDDLVSAEGLVKDPAQVSGTKVEEEDAYSDIFEESEKHLDWLDLSMLAKLESLYTLAEWQFQNPNRVRHQMKTDDDQAAWRIEPIGYDAKRNAYWLIGGDRLWIQREPPRSDLKRKRKSSRNSSNTARMPQSSTTKRQRIDADLEATGLPPAARFTRSKAKFRLTPSPRGARAAKTRANQRLDAQARDIVKFQDQMAGSRTKAISTSPRKPTGVRVSARLRGIAVEDDEWQEVPDEWLAVTDIHQRHAKDTPGRLPTSKEKMKTGLESEESSISELTELSDAEGDTVRAEEELHEDPVVGTEEVGQENDIGEIEDQQDEEAKLIDSPITPQLPDDFVEWETICVILEDWESIAQQFEKATHYAEKALYKVLSQSIVPMITAELREAEKKRRVEEAVVHRKRSSRIAMKEIEKEEERAAMRKRMEEEEKMSRTRRLEARQQREQAERLKRESAREQRRMEREFQEQQSAETCEAESKPDASGDITQEDTSSNLLPSKTLITLNPAPINGTGSGSRSPFENWVLDCEVCGRTGVNQDDGVPLLCCGKCGKWQHIVCHDEQDTMAGRPKRNWDSEDFICQQCRLMISSKNSLGGPSSFLSFGINNKRGQTPGSQACFILSDHRSHSNSGYYQDSSTAGYPGDHPDARVTNATPSTHSYTSQTRSTGVTFAHYQPQQGGFSTSRPTYSVQDVHSIPQARYAITPHTFSPGTTTYPSTVNSQATTHSPTQVHEQWLPPSYPRTPNSYPVNGTLPLTQGVRPYYNGHAHTPYSHLRGANNQTVLGQYAGLQHVSSYQHSK